jgi:hypothetical protein
MEVHEKFYDLTLDQREQLIVVISINEEQYYHKANSN